MRERNPLTIRPFQTSDHERVIQIWQETNLTRPWNDPAKDIARKLTVQPELFVIGLVGNEIVATAMAGYDGHRGWVNYLAVAPNRQGHGYAGQIMDYLEERLIELGCPKINLQVRSDNASALEFYDALGYKADQAVSLGKRLIPDD